MYRSLVALTLAVVVAACSDDGSDKPAAIDEMRVVKVSGDQSAQVPAESPSASLGVRYATVGTDGWTDSALVARVEAVEPQASMTGPSFVVVPSGTLVHWRIADGGGELFGATTATDDSAYTYNRWRPGTVAGTYTAEAGRLIDGEIVIDAAWTLEVMPGAVVRAGFSAPTSPLSEGDTIDIRGWITGGLDQYGNAVSADTIRALPDSVIGWAWASRVCRPGCPSLPQEPTDTGWVTVVPPLDETTEGYDGTHPLSLIVWIMTLEEDWYEIFVTAQP